MPTTDNVTVRELYTLVDQKVGEVGKSVLRLEAKFDNLESGRLSTLEQNLANLQGRMMMIPLIISIAMNGFFFIVEFILYKKP